MKNDLTCAVVRDLLPPYIEGLTEEETNEAVKSHLETCLQCRERHDAMCADTQADTREEKEVDYLKQVNRQGKRRTARAVLLALVIVGLILGGIALDLFVVGDEATSEGMSWSIQQDGNYLNVRAYTVWSGVAYCRWETEQVGDTVYIRTTKVLPSYLYPTADNRMRIPLESVNHVYLAERLIWSEGEAIHTRVLDLMEHKVEYVGDASAIIGLGQALGLDELGNYTTGLRTATEPYRWQVEFTSGDKDTINDHMMVNSLYMLALVENLEQVSWTAPSAAERITDVKDADRFLDEFLVDAYERVYDEDLDFPESIKDCGTPAGLAKLEKLKGYLEAYR